MVSDSCGGGGRVEQENTVSEQLPSDVLLIGTDQQYRLRLVCTNCAKDNIVTLPKGVKFESWRASCDHCGCFSLVRKTP